VDLLPKVLQRAPGIRAYQHWALEIGGLYYELHRTEWKECRVSTEDRVLTSKRTVIDKKPLGFTHDSDDELSQKGMRRSV